MIGRTNIGGASLNFKVVGGLTEPAGLAENTLWVYTEEPITSYSFDVTAPAEPEQGMVWVKTGASSNIAFNALKKNAIQVYPISVQQYIDGAWVDVPAKSYQGGELVDLWNGELYSYGNEYTDITGGIDKYGTCELAKGETALVLTGIGEGGVFPENKVDLTDFDTVECKIIQRATNMNIRLLVSSEKVTTFNNSNVVAVVETGYLASGAEHTLSVDVSSLTGEYYIGVGRFQSGSSSCDVCEWTCVR